MSPAAVPWSLDEPGRRVRTAASRHPPRTRPAMCSVPTLPRITSSFRRTCGTRAPGRARAAGARCASGASSGGSFRTRTPAGIGWLPAGSASGCCWSAGGPGHAAAALDVGDSEGQRDQRPVQITFPFLRPRSVSRSGLLVVARTLLDRFEWAGNLVRAVRIRYYAAAVRAAGIRVAVPIEALEARLSGLPEGVSVEPWVGAHGQAAPGRHPHARRLARSQPGSPRKPGRGRPGVEARSHQGRDAGALAGDGEPLDRRPAPPASCAFGAPGPPRWPEPRSPSRTAATCTAAAAGNRYGPSIAATNPTRRRGCLPSAGAPRRKPRSISVVGDIRVGGGGHGPVKRRGLPRQLGGPRRPTSSSASARSRLQPCASRSRPAPAITP